jgi:hypothetical protein
MTLGEAAERTFNERRKEHVAASMRASFDHAMYRNLYLFYPWKNVTQTVAVGCFPRSPASSGFGYDES